MASKSLDFVFNLIDRVSAPGRRIGKTFEDIDRIVRTGGAGMNDSLRRLATNMGLPTRAAGLLAASITTVGTASRAFDVARSRANQLWSSLGHVRTLAFGLPTIVAGGTAGLLGKTAINAAAAKEQSLIAFEMLTGSPEGAQALWDDIRLFDASTPFQFEDVVENWQKLLTAGFSSFEIPIVLSAIGDLAALKGMDKEAISQLTDTFARINARGKLSRLEYESLTLAGGVRQDSLLENLATAYETSIDHVRDMISTGSIDPQTAYWAVIESIKNDFSGGVLGGAMKRFTNSLTGIWADLTGRPNDILRDAFQGFDKDNEPVELPGFSSLRRFLSNIREATDETTDIGKRTADRIRGLFSDVFSGIFDPLAAATDPVRIQAAIDRLFNRIETGMDWIRTNVPPVIAVLKEFFTGIRTGAGYVITGVTWAIERIQTFATWLQNLLGLTGDGVGSVAKFAGTITGVSVALKLLNAITFGLSGTLLRLAANALRAFVTYVAGAMWTAGVWAVQAARIAGGWLLAFGQSMLTAIGSALTALGAFVARTAVAATRWLVNAGRIAVGWVIAMGPVAWIIAGIIALGGILVWAYNKFDWFREFVDGALSAIGDAAKTAFAVVTQAGKDALEWLQALPQRINDAVSGMWDDFIAATRDAFADILGFIQPAIDKVNDFISTVKGWFGKNETQLVIGDNGVVNGLTMTPREDLVDTLTPVGVNLIPSMHGADILPLGLLAEAGRYSEDVAGQLYAGWQQGLYSDEADLLQAFEDLTDRTIRAVEDGYEIRSPSRVFARIGEMVGTGFVTGLTSTTGSIDRALATVFDQTTEPTAGGSVSATAPDGTHQAGASVHIGDINVTVPAGTSTSDAEAIAAAVKQALIDTFEDLGLSAGALP